MKISSNAVVSLRYVMKNSNGEVVEDIMNLQPVVYLHGSGNILPALEMCLEGLEAGDQKSISISNETISQLTEQFYFDVIIDDVRPATKEEVKKGKTAEPAASGECGPDCCC